MKPRITRRELVGWFRSCGVELDVRRSGPFAYVTGTMRCAESATATARWRWISSSDSGSAAVASGWWGATAKTKSMSPRGLTSMPWAALSMGTPRARSAAPP